MTANTFADADTRSPWYETFVPWMHLWFSAGESHDAPEPPAESEASDDGWATEAIFDYYND